MTAAIEKIEDLFHYLDSLEGKPVFRGQSNYDWGLVPSLYRGLDGLDLYGFEEWIADRERDIVREFSDKSRTLRSGLETPWDILTLAQHYGTPTRLLDWTSNPQHALYFAASSQPDMDGAIWCALPSALPMPQIGRLHEGLGYRKERLNAYIRESELAFCMPQSKVAVSLPSFLRGDDASEVDEDALIGDTAELQEFDQSGVDDMSGVLTFYLPDNSNDRVAAQTGLFSVYITKATYELVIDHEKYLRAVETHANVQILEKVALPAAAKTDLLRSLDRINVNSRTVFPDLNGLGMHLSGWQRGLVAEVAQGLQ